MEKVGGYRVSIDNDTRAMIYGEYMQGVVKGEKNIIFSTQFVVHIIDLCIFVLSVLILLRNIMTLLLSACIS